MPSTHAVIIEAASGTPDPLERRKALSVSLGIFWQLSKTTTARPWRPGVRIFASCWPVGLDRGNSGRISLAGDRESYCRPLVNGMEGLIELTPRLRELSKARIAYAVFTDVRR